jgi:hypothetical protein
VEERVSAGLSRSSGRRFAFTVGSAFLVISAVGWIRQHPFLLIVFGLPGVVLLLAGWIVPQRLTLLFRLWMALARAISKVTTPIAMSAVYFFAFTPVGIIKRLAGRDALRRSEDAGGYWVRRDTDQNSQSDLERQF